MTVQDLLTYLEQYCRHQMSQTMNEMDNSAERFTMFKQRFEEVIDDWIKLNPRDFVISDTRTFLLELLQTLDIRSDLKKENLKVIGE